MHDSARTHTDRHTHHSVKHVVLQTAPATWDRAALCSLYKKHGSPAVLNRMLYVPVLVQASALVKKETIEVIAATRRKLSGTSPDGQHL